MFEDGTYIAPMPRITTKARTLEDFRPFYIVINLNLLCLSKTLAHLLGVSSGYLKSNSFSLIFILKKPPKHYSLSFVVQSKWVLFKMLPGITSHNLSFFGRLDRARVSYVGPLQVLGDLAIVVFENSQEP
jgi:hypothetical protein